MMISPGGGKNRDKQPGTKGSSPSTSSGGGVGQRPTSSSLKPPEQALRCPRCDSSNTKFCYYNNYSLTQPRHFCKTCRRYWTKGGALRNVPIGGGCRKTKKAKSGRTSSSLINSGGSNDYAGGGGSSVGEIGGFKLFQSVSPAADFQLSLPRLYNNFSSSGISCFQTDQVGSVNSNFPISSAVGFSGINHHHQVNAMHGGDHSMSAPGGGDLASSIESLSCINQDMHWKLQQQRIASMIQHHDDSGCSRLQGSVTDTSCATATTNANFENQAHVVKPFAGLWMSGGGMTAATTTMGTEEWFLGSSFAPVGSSSMALPPGAGNGSGSGGWSTGVQAWSDLQQFTHLP